MDLQTLYDTIKHLPIRHSRKPIMVLDIGLHLIAALHMVCLYDDQIMLMTKHSEGEYEHADAVLYHEVMTVPDNDSQFEKYQLWRDEVLRGVGLLIANMLVHRLDSSVASMLTYAYESEAKAAPVAARIAEEMGGIVAERDVLEGSNEDHEEFLTGLMQTLEFSLTWDDDTEKTGQEMREQIMGYMYNNRLMMASGFKGNNVRPLNDEPESSETE